MPPVRVASDRSPDSPLPRALSDLRAPLLAAIRRAAPAWLQPEADDLTQVALLRLNRAIEQDPDRPLTRGYLGRIAYTTVIDEIRGRRKEREHADRDAEVERAPAPLPGPERLAQSAHLRQDLTHCLEEAQPRVRDALTLYLLGHTVPEIARLLEHTRKTAENIVYRGLGALRECLLAKGHAP